jgi:hypothetical protein
VIVINHKSVRRSTGQFLLLFSIFGLAAGCNMPVAQEIVTPSPNLTQVIATVQGRLTQTATPAMSWVFTPTVSVIAASTTPLPTLLSTPSQTPLPGGMSLTPPGQEACERAGAGTPFDITIPDDAVMKPGESFTKIWRLQNMGSCPWTTDYRVFFFSGEQLGAVSSIALPREVPPGESIDIALDMVAPGRAGTFQGNWKLRNPAGNAFGIGPSGSAPFWVRIVVEVTPTATASQTATPTYVVIPAPLTPGPETLTPSATMTETPPTSLGVSLIPGEALDLDSGEINNGAGQDIVYESNPDGLHRITLQSGVGMSLFGEQIPTRSDCESAPLEATSLVAVNLVQRYTCFRTDRGQPGWFFLQEINPNTYTAEVEFFTWGGP